MPSAPKIIPISDLRQNASDVVKSVSATKQPVFITQRGRAAAVMVSMEAYEEAQHEIDILRLLGKGEKEVEANGGQGGIRSSLYVSPRTIRLWAYNKTNR